VVCRPWPKAFASALLTVSLLLPLCGCKREDKLTLREAEELAHEWLDSTQKLLEAEYRQRVHESAEGDEEAEEVEEDWGLETLRDCFCG